MSGVEALKLGDTAGNRKRENFAMRSAVFSRIFNLYFTLV